MAAPNPFQKQLDTLADQVQRRGFMERHLDKYYEGDAPLPDVIVSAKITKAYMLLMGLSNAPWGSLVVDSVQDRLEVTGIESDDEDVDDTLWGVWQDNKMDSESKLAHKTSLIAGRSFALVWPDDETGQPEISLDGPGQMIVQYEEGSRHERAAAMRFWMSDDERVPYANLYLPDGIYKFIGPKDSYGPSGVRWEQRNVEGEPWPVPNPWNVVPVVELPVNRRLKPGPWGFARGEYEHCVRLSTASTSSPSWVWWSRSGRASPCAA